MTWQILKKNNPCPSLKSCQILGKVLIKFAIPNYLNSGALNQILVSISFWKHVPILLPFRVSKGENQNFSVSFNWIERQFCQGIKLGLNPFLNDASFLKLIKGEKPYTKSNKWTLSYVLLSKRHNKKMKIQIKCWQTIILQYHYFDGVFSNMCLFFQNLAFYLETNDISVSPMLVRCEIGVRNQTSFSELPSQNNYLFC